MIEQIYMKLKIIILLNMIQLIMVLIQGVTLKQNKLIFKNIDKKTIINNI
jgi:hypothetical protein